MQSISPSTENYSPHRVFFPVQRIFSRTENYSPHRKLFLEQRIIPCTEYYSPHRILFPAQSIIPHTEYYSLRRVLFPTQSIISRTEYVLFPAQSIIPRRESFWETTYIYKPRNISICIFGEIKINHISFRIWTWIPKKNLHQKISCNFIFELGRGLNFSRSLYSRYWMLCALPQMNSFSCIYMYTVHSVRVEYIMGQITHPSTPHLSMCKYREIGEGGGDREGGRDRDTEIEKRKHEERKGRYKIKGWEVKEECGIFKGIV